MNNINNGQSAAKPLNNKYGESSTTIETIIDTNNNNGVEYTRNSGNGGNFENNTYCANRKKSCAGYNWKYFQDYDIV